MENSKYELTDETKRLRSGQLLHRIKALRQIGKCKPGALGGWIESEKNLSTDGECWVHSGAMVYGNARVTDNAKVQECARVYGDALICENARVMSKSRVFDHAIIRGTAWVHQTSQIYDYAEISGNVRVHQAEIYGHAELTDDAICFRAKVYDHAKLLGHANVVGIDSEIYGFARVSGHAKIKTSAHIFENADISGNAIVEENSRIYGNAHIRDHAICQGNADVSGFTLLDGHTVVSDYICKGAYSTRKDTILPGEPLWVIDHSNPEGMPELKKRMYLSVLGNIIISTNPRPSNYDVAEHLAKTILEGTYHCVCDIYFDYAYNCYFCQEEAEKAAAALNSPTQDD